MLPGVCCEYQIYKHINNITKVANKEAVRILYYLNMIFYYLNFLNVSVYPIMNVLPTHI